MEVGSVSGHDQQHTRPADVLVPNWDLGKPAAFDLTVASPLNQNILNGACVTAGSSARVSEQRKHASNGAVLTHDEMLSFPCHTHVHCISRGISMPACISNSSY